MRMWHGVNVLTLCLARVNAMVLRILDWFCVLAKGVVFGSSKLWPRE